MIVKNLYKVPQAQWRKWDNAEKSLFNSLYSDMYNNQSMYLHPKQEPTKRTYWSTTAWNAA